MKPFWSVMIPVYRPDGYLSEALQSVLDQAPGPDEMQIMVVDDCPADTEVENRIRAIGGERIEFFKNPKNLGLAGNWNHCIELARGKWIHILHHDDRVYPGFYETLRQMIEKHPDAGAAVCGNDFLDSQGAPLDFGDRTLHPEAGPLPDAVATLAEKNLLQCPAVVVQRSTYDAIGGFDARFVFAVDWEMWVRIAARFPVLYHPQILASYRVHPSSETSSLAKSGETVRDCFRAIDRFSTYLPPSRRRTLRRTAIRWASDMAYNNAHEFMKSGKVEWAMAQFHLALSRETRFPAWRDAVMSWRHAIRLTKRAIVPPVPFFPRAWFRPKPPAPPETTRAA